MADSFLLIPRLGDKTALDLFRTIHKKHASQNFNVSIAGLPTINLSNAADAELVNRIDATSSFVIGRIGIHYNHFSAEYIRGGNVNPPSALYDQIKFTYADNQQNALPNKDRLDIVQLINERVGPSPMAGMFSPQSTKGLDDLAGLYRSTVLRLLD
jgi:hypothetical protein